MGTMREFSALHVHSLWVGLADDPGISQVLHLWLPASGLIVLPLHGSHCVVLAFGAKPAAHSEHPVLGSKPSTHVQFAIPVPALEQSEAFPGWKGGVSVVSSDDGRIPWQRTPAKRLAVARATLNMATLLCPAIITLAFQHTSASA